jgi:hypothetical protein
MVPMPRPSRAVAAALKHPCAGVRKTAVQVLPRNAASVETLLAADALHDKEPLVTLNALLALSEMPATPAAGNAVLARLAEMGATEDRWLPDAFACNLTAHEGKLLKTYLAGAAKSAKENSSGPGGYGRPHRAPPGRNDPGGYSYHPRNDYGQRPGPRGDGPADRTGFSLGAGNGAAIRGSAEPGRRGHSRGHRYAPGRAH